MLFHFDFDNYFKMLRLAWNEKNPRARRTYLAKLLLWVPPVSLCHAICFFLDNLFFPGLHKTAIRTPVFVVGHARSGTTLVHRLMSEDEGQFSSFRLYEMFFPSLLEKKLIRALGRFDQRWLGGEILRRVRAYDEKTYGPSRHIHPTGIFEYEEDDQVLYYSMAAGFWITKMPYMGDLDFYYVDRWPERRKRRMMRFYADCIRRQLYLNGRDRIHLSKNPVFPGRLETLLETFPDARIVVPVRNPYETIPSLLELMRSGWKALGWDPARQQRCLSILAEQSFHTYLYPLEVIARHPEVPHAVIDYRDLVSDPVASIESIYRAIGLPLSPGYREVLLAEGKRARQHKSSHSYSLEKFGLDAGAIRKGLAGLFEQYRWDKESA